MKNGIPTMTHIFDPNSDITTLDDKILQELTIQKANYMPIYRDKKLAIIPLI